MSGLCGRDTLNLNLLPSQSCRSCVEVEVAVSDSPYGPLWTESNTELERAAFTELQELCDGHT